MKTKTVIIIVLLLLAALLVEARTRGKQNKIKGRGKKTPKVEAAHYLTPDQPEFWFNCLLATFLALAGGFCSGMTVGLNSLSILNLEIMQKSSDSHTKGMADRILAVIHDHHLFLTTLLVGNAIVLQSLPLVIHLIMPDWAAILFSTIVVLIVAEVVPMSWSTGSHKYIIAYYGAPLVSVMIKAFWPLCYPMARGLDRLLGGDHEERILRRDFLTFINDKRKNELDQLEIEFINNVMNHSDKNLKKIMTPIDSVFMLEESQFISHELMQQISELEYSYILVYRQSREHLLGFIKTKEFILHYLQLRDHTKPVPIHKVMQKPLTKNLVKVYHDAIATEALEILEISQAPLILVTDLNKHQPKQHEESSSNLTVLSVYEAKEWVVREECKVVGVVTLTQLLYEIADYPTEALKVSQRKLSGHHRSLEGK